MIDYKELQAQVSEAIWDALEEYVDMGYVDRTRGIIDTGMADNLDMDKIAGAAIKVVLSAAYPFIRYPQWEITAPGSFEIGP